MLEMSQRDQELVEQLDERMETALSQADNPIAVTKRIAVLATRRRNRGRKAAMRRHPFPGICESSGLPLARENAHLDELEPELGYAGRLQWVCPRANNSGKLSCGACD